MVVLTHFFGPAAAALQIFPRPCSKFLRPCANISPALCQYVSGPVPVGTFALPVHAEVVVVAAASLIDEPVKVTRIGEWWQVRNWQVLVARATAKQDEERQAAAAAGDPAAAEQVMES